ncbi:choice-of-anchor L domain-containing protein [Psychroflexus salis]|uniref:BAH domain-containing protein n=1 Tax=Psychroflexus salis TaxID=1526574 RepID=A0A916ZZE1_9FLAO|nr:choice-of-anchor L domain-containing protein [Psychroflexus salis]GGE20027.1 hypothetical protein GCM10010831_21430 [Psychroflexus salis]
MKIFYLPFVLLFTYFGYSQDFNWTSDFNDTDQIDTCNATLALNNNDGNLSNQNKTLTICPSDPDEVISLEFISFSLNTTFSTLEIYNGNSTNSPLVFEYVSDAIPPNPSYIASNPSGCITIKFTTTFIPSIINIGFGAQFVCGDPCQDIFPEVNIDGNTTCETTDDIPYYLTNEMLTFNGSALTSNNTPAEDLNFDWEIDGDDYSGESIQLTFTEVDEIDATLTVTDAQGCQQSIDFEFEIRNDLLNINEVDDEFTLNELVSDVFIAGDCAIVDNINSPNNLNIYNSDDQSIGYFSKGCSDFPFENGIVIGSGSVNNIKNPSSGENNNWPGEDELATLVTGDPNVGTSNNATVIEFEFSSYENEISFNYIFASDEYGGNFVCNFADTFAFILSGPGINDINTYNNDANPNTPAIDLDLGGLNIASIDDGSGNGLIPTTPTNIHPNTDCAEGSLGEFALFQLYNQDNPPYHTLDGETQVLTATATVIPCETYTMKIMVADFQDNIFNSFVFLEGGSFNLGANLGDDIFFTDAEPLFEGDVFTVEAFEDDLEGGVCNFSIEWYKDGELIPNETDLTLDITETGNYEIFIISEENSTLANCNSSDSIYVEFIPVPNPDNIDDIQDILICQPPLNVFNINLRTNDDFVLGTQNPDNFNVDYFLSEVDANAGVNAIDDPENFEINATELQNENITIWIRVEEALTGNAQSFVTSSFQIRVAEPDLSSGIPNLQSCQNENTGFGVFDLSEVESSIFQINESSAFVISYFNSEADAQNNTSPIININNYETDSTSETIWVRLESNFNSDCYEVASFEAEIYQQPEINQLPDLQVCGDYSDNPSFDLSSISPNSVNTPNPDDTLLSLYTTEADAIANINPITQDLSNYQLPNGVFSQDLYVRLTNNNENGSCFTISNFTLNINNVTINPVEDLVACQDDTTALPVFDLTQQSSTLLEGNSILDSNSLSFYQSENDAINATNEIVNLQNFSASSLNQSIWARVESGANPDCFETTSFNLVTQELADVNLNVDDIIVCDNTNNSGFYEDFNFNVLIPQINNLSLSDVTISFHETQIDADNGINAISSPYTNILAFAQTIFVRVENGTNLSSCKQFTSFDIFVNALPEVTLPNEPLLDCDEDADGFANFDLTAFEAILFENTNANNFSVAYYETEADAINQTNPIANPQLFIALTGFTPIYIAVDNGDCPIVISTGVNVNPDDVSCEGIGVDDFSKYINVYPNPVSTNLQINYSAGTPIETIQIFNLNGQLVFQKQYNGLQSHLELNFDEYAAGVYLIKISAGKQTNIQKIVKK